MDCVGIIEWMADEKKDLEALERERQRRLTGKKRGREDRSSNANTHYSDERRGGDDVSME
jgi:hypothetical protein